LSHNKIRPPYSDTDVYMYGISTGEYSEDFPVNVHQSSLAMSPKFFSIIATEAPYPKILDLVVLGSRWSCHLQQSRRIAKRWYWGYWNLARK